MTMRHNGCINEATAEGGKPDRRRKKHVCLAAEIPSLLFRGVHEVGTAV